MEYTDVTLHFNDEELSRMKEKFDIQTADDLRRACYECIETYLEL